MRAMIFNMNRSHISPLKQRMRSLQSGLRAPIALGVIITLSWAISACSSLPSEALDPPLTDTLKQRITKARNAIIETRKALARAQGTAYLEELKIRLAELLSDEARAHYQVARAQEGVSDKPLHVPQVKTLKQKAINEYLEFLTEFPRSTLAPRALFNMGQEYRELGDYDKMRSTFERLVEEHSKSMLSLEALLVLGDDAFDRGDLDQAGIRFEKIIDHPRHKSTGFAHYKLGWVRMNQDRCKDAITSFERAIKETQKWLDGLKRGSKLNHIDSSLDVRREALTDMMFCYGRDRPEKGAVDVIKTLAYDRGPLVSALEKLARRYNVLERWKGARDVTRALLDLAPSTSKRLEDAQNLHNALVKLKDFTRVGDDVRRLSSTVQRAVSAPQLEEAAREQLLSEYEQYIRDLSTKAQELLEKKYGKKKVPYNQSVRQVALAYETYLHTFETSESRLDILSNLATVYGYAEQHMLSGRRFYERSLISAKSADTKISSGALADAYQAVLHFQNALGEGHHTQADRVIARAALRRAAAKLLTSKLNDKQGPQVRFAIAQTFYEEGRLDEAIEYLSAVATEYPNTKQGDASALLVLDAYKQNNDFLGLALSGERLIKAGLNPTLKPRVTALIKQARQQELDELALEASGVDGGDVTQELMQFADANANTPLGERAFLNAFVAARATGDLEGMRRIAELIMTQYPKSEQLSGVYTSLARSSIEQLDVKGALDAFERASDRAPQQAITLRSASAQVLSRVGDIEGALKILKSTLTEITPQGKSGLTLYADLLIRFRSPSNAWSALEPFKEDATPEMKASIGYLQVLRKEFDEAEETIQGVIEGGDDLPINSRALGLYVQAEVYAHFLKSFAPGDSIDEIAEWVTLMELAEQGYLKVARTGHALWGSAALNRLAALSQFTSKKIRTLKPPSELDSTSRQKFAQGFEKRSQFLAKQSEQALKACRELGWKRGFFTPPVLLCLKNEVMSAPGIPQEAYQPRTTQAGRDVGKSDREAFAKNPQDFNAALRLGQILLKSNDPHLARLALSQALEGGGPEVNNLYGIACARIQDWNGAFEGFGRAAVAGFEAGIVNMKKLLRERGINEALKEIDQVWTAQTSGGDLW